MTSTSGRGWRDGSRDDPSLSEILYVLHRRRLLVVGAVLVLAGISLLLGLFREPVYTAEARVIVVPQGRLEGEDASLAFQLTLGYYAYPRLGRVDRLAEEPEEQGDASKDEHGPDDQ